MKKSKKIGLISLLILDIGVTLFLFIVSIIMLATMPDATKRQEIIARGPQNMIEWFQVNTTAYLCIGVIPLFLLLAVNIVLLVMYVKKVNAKKKVALSDLSDDEKEALRKELLKDLQDDNEEDK